MGSHHLCSEPRGTSRWLSDLSLARLSLASLPQLEKASAPPPPTLHAAARVIPNECNLNPVLLCLKTIQWLSTVYRRQRAPYAACKAMSNLASCSISDLPLHASPPEPICSLSSALSPTVFTTSSQSFTIWFLVTSSEWLRAWPLKSGKPCSQPWLLPTY